MLWRFRCGGGDSRPPRNSGNLYLLFSFSVRFLLLFLYSFFCFFEFSVNCCYRERNGETGSAWWRWWLRGKWNCDYCWLRRERDWEINSVWMLKKVEENERCTEVEGRAQLIRASIVEALPMVDWWALSEGKGEWLRKKRRVWKMNWRVKSGMCRVIWRWWCEYIDIERVENSVRFWGIRALGLWNSIMRWRVRFESVEAV